MEGSMSIDLTDPYDRKALGLSPLDMEAVFIKLYVGEPLTDEEVFAIRPRWLRDQLEETEIPTKELRALPGLLPGQAVSPENYTFGAKSIILPGRIVLEYHCDRTTGTENVEKTNGSVVRHR
jgi:hypothetical protein